MVTLGRSIHPSAWRNCLENGPRPLERASSTSRSVRSGPLRPLLAAFGTPILRVSRFSKQFRKGYSQKFTTKSPKITHLGDALGIIECGSYLVTSLARRCAPMTTTLCLPGADELEKLSELPTEVAPPRATSSLPRLL